jgi:hypothetical protein
MSRASPATQFFYRFKKNGNKVCVAGEAQPQAYLSTPVLIELGTLRITVRTMELLCLLE